MGERDRLVPADVPIEIREFQPAQPANVEDVNQVIRWSTRESMVAISALSIRTHNFAHAAYRTDTERIVGYAAITHIYSASVVELGGLVVDPTARGRQVGSELTREVVRSIKRMMAPDLIIAFSNTGSAPIFKKLGGEQIEDAASLPPEVWKVCHTCRFYDDALEENKACCGRVYDITSISE